MCFQKLSWSSPISHIFRVVGYLDNCQEKAGKPDWEIVTNMRISTDIFEIRLLFLSIQALSSLLDSYHYTESE